MSWLLLVYADALSESVTRGFAGCACVKGDIKSRSSAVISMTLISGTTIRGCIDLTRIQSLSKQPSLNMGMIGTEQSIKGNWDRATARVSPTFIERQLQRFPWMLGFRDIFCGHFPSNASISKDGS